MIVGIMQPYFFPYLEQFRLIDACDLWIVFDTVHYAPKSWMNRNRILNNGKDFTYVTVPVMRNDKYRPVAQARISKASDWRNDILNRFSFYDGVAPFYGETVDLLKGSITPDTDYLAALNTRCLRTVCQHLGISTPIKQLSEMALTLPEITDPGDWALEISIALSADEYRNPFGGKHLFSEEKFAAHGVKLSFHKHAVLTYATGRFPFLENASVLDTLCWLGQQQVKDFICQNRAV